MTPEVAMMGRRTMIARRPRRDDARWVGVTAIPDGRTHLIDEAVLAVALAAGSGRLPVVCGGIVVPAALGEPPGRPCPLCRAALALSPDGRPSRGRASGRPS
jgi:hypothetical protein